MATRQDCPKCGRKGNEGHVYYDTDFKKLSAFETVAGGICGFMIGGPVGAAVGAAGAEKGMKWLMKQFQTDNKGYVWYRFNCMNPNCKHTWVSKVKE